MMYNQQILTQTIPMTPKTADDASRLIDELRELYLGHFDNYWFTALLEENAFDTSRLRAVRTMLESQSVYCTEASVFRDAIESLELIVITSKRYLLPELRDKLRVSGFYSGRSGESREEMVMRNMFCYTFPHNLQRLEEITSELKESLL